MKHLGINGSIIPVTEFSSNYYDNNVSDTANESCQHGLELQSLCSLIEKSLTRAYSDLLDEPLPCKSLQEIIIYQLNALKISFLKIQTLNTARFAMY